MSLDLSGEITAIATAVLAVFAIVTAFYARQAFRKQSQEVSAIERQVTDQQELTRQQAELLQVQSSQLDLQRQQLDDQHMERRRAQASLVSIWTEWTGDSSHRVGTVHIENKSLQPIRNLFVFWDNEPDPGDKCEFFSFLGPGDRRDKTLALPAPFPDPGDPAMVGVSMFFQDAAGVRWRIRRNGQLEEKPLPNAPIVQ